MKSVATASQARQRQLCFRPFMRGKGDVYDSVVEPQKERPTTNAYLRSVGLTLTSKSYHTSYQHYISTIHCVLGLPLPSLQGDHTHLLCDSFFGNCLSHRGPLIPPDLFVITFICKGLTNDYLPIALLAFAHGYRQNLCSKHDNAENVLTAETLYSNMPKPSSNFFLLFIMQTRLSLLDDLLLFSSAEVRLCHSRRTRMYRV